MSNTVIEIGNIPCLFDVLPDVIPGIAARRFKKPMKSTGFSESVQCLGWGLKLLKIFLKFGWEKSTCGATIFYGIASDVKYRPIYRV